MPAKQHSQVTRQKRPYKRRVRGLIKKVNVERLEELNNLPGAPDNYAPNALWEKEKKIVYLRVNEGMDFKQIAEIVGMEVAAVRRTYHKIVNRVTDLDDVRKLIENHAARYANARIDLQGLIDESLDSGRSSTVIDGYRTVLQFEEREAKLFGLDAPKSVHIGISANPLGSMASNVPISEQLLIDIQDADPVKRDHFDVETVSSCDSQADTGETNTAVDPNSEPSSQVVKESTSQAEVKPSKRAATFNAG